MKFSSRSLLFPGDVLMPDGSGVAGNQCLCGYVRGDDASRAHHGPIADRRARDDDPGADPHPVPDYDRSRLWQLPSGHKDVVAVAVDDARPPGKTRVRTHRDVLPAGNIRVIVDEDPLG